MRGRYDETATRTDIVLKEARAKVDEAYRIIIERVNALMIIEGEADYADFVRRLNSIVDKYANTIAQQQGSSTATNAKKKKTTDDLPTPVETPDDTTPSDDTTTDTTPPSDPAPRGRQ